MGKLSLPLGSTAKMGQEFHKLIGAEHGYSIGWIEKHKLWDINLVQMKYDDTHKL